MWAKSKRLSAGVLRKAAILNRMRRSSENGLASAVGKGNSLNGAAGLGGQEGILRPGFAVLQGTGVQCPSPLGLSNYDALDEEDVWVEMETEEAEEAEPYPSHLDFGLPEPTQQPASVEEEKEEHVQPEKENSLDLPTGSPNFVGGDVKDIRSPNCDWLASTLASEALASLGVIGKSFLPSCRRDALVEIKREKERQRRLLDLQLQFG